MNSNSINPFTTDIVSDPRAQLCSVSHLNCAVVQQISDKVMRLAEGDRPRYDNHRRKALLLTASRAGAGKSHLIGQLFQELAGKATLVYVRPFEDPETVWISVLERMVQELRFADRFADSDALDVDQVSLFAHGILSQIVADFLEQNGKDNKATIAILRRPTRDLINLKKNKNWNRYLQKFLANGDALNKIENHHRMKGLVMHQSLVVWMKVLYGFAYSSDENTRCAAVEWMAAQPIEESDFAALNIRQANAPHADQSVLERNQTAKYRVLDLCSLATFFRPFLICFDQTENYGKSPALARALGCLVTDLADEAKNLCTLMSTNQDPWEKRLRENWEEAHLDRLEKPFLSLKGIDEQQALELITLRMEQFQIETQVQQSFIAGSWLTDYFLEKGEANVRQLLVHCSEQWQKQWLQEGKQPEESKVASDSLLQLYDHYQDNIRVQARRLVFDRDALYWLVSELPDGLQDIELGQYNNRQTGRSPSWVYKNRKIHFGFETGSHWKRWNSIAKASMEPGDAVSVFFRTMDLQKIPKATWKVAGPIMQSAMQHRLYICELDKNTLIRIYAAHDLYADAQQGDVPFTVPQVTEFLQQEMQNIRDLILQWPNNQAVVREEIPEDQPVPEVVWSEELRNIVRQDRFVSLEDVVGKIPADVQKEAVLDVCQNDPSIHIHHSPQMIVLQWQSQ